MAKSLTGNASNNDANRCVFCNGIGSAAGIRFIDTIKWVCDDCQNKWIEHHLKGHFYFKRLKVITDKIESQINRGLAESE